MTPFYVLVHGWGLSPASMRPLASALGSVDAALLDLGFGGAPSFPTPPAGRRIVAIGHSFGLLWLLWNRPFAWDRLVSVNGFTRFVQGPDFADGTPSRLIGRMQRRLEADPAAVCRDFLARIGADPALAPSGGLHRARLADGLAGLAGWDCRDGAAAVDLVLAGRNDPLCPPAMTEAAFPGRPIRWHEGGHLLPVADPGWCARAIDATIAVEAA